MTIAPARIEAYSDLPQIVGEAAIIRAIYEGRDIMPLWNGLFARITDDMSDAAALFDISIILNAMGQKEQAVLTQAAALRLSRTFSVHNDRDGDIDLLVLMAAGDFMANTPIEFLLEDARINILPHYVDAETKSLADVPAHDIAFVAVAESSVNLPVLENLDRLLAGWRGPIMNNAPLKVMDLSRDGVAGAFGDEPTIVTPTITRVPRSALEGLAVGAVEMEAIAGFKSFPAIVRPLDSHAGKGMTKIDGVEALKEFLDRYQDEAFFIAPFIDYSGPDGRFRKYRIAFIDGRAFASHMAISEHWMVHYLNAGMTKHQDRRDEEAAWMASFDEDFAVRHAQAFAALCRRFQLDYFAIDCAELSDGSLLLFEADVAMIVHSMDSAEMFPYKKAPMQKIFTAFEAALRLRTAKLAVAR